MRECGCSLLLQESGYNLLLREPGFSLLLQDHGRSLLLQEHGHSLLTIGEEKEMNHRKIMGDETIHVRWVRRIKEEKIKGKKREKGRKEK